MLLGEHMELIIDAQRTTFAGSSEFKAAAQVNANTATLTKAIWGIVGPQKAAEFEAAWANHVEGLLAYSTAVAGNDEAAKITAAQNLDGFGARLALYFSDIVRNELPVEALTDVLGVHDKHLIEQVNAYATDDYATAQKLQLEGYQQMLGVAHPGRRDPRRCSRAAGGRLQDRRRRHSTAAAMTRQAGGHRGHTGAAERLHRSGVYPADPPSADRAAHSRTTDRAAGTGGRPRLPRQARLSANACAGTAPHPQDSGHLPGRSAAPDGTVEVPNQFDLAGWYASAHDQATSGRRSSSDTST